jgi:hypothetical protein
VSNAAELDSVKLVVMTYIFNGYVPTRDTENRYDICMRDCRMEGEKYCKVI